jgi:hypothetical protein
MRFTKSDHVDLSTSLTCASRIPLVRNFRLAVVFDKVLGEDWLFYSAAGSLVRSIPIFRCKTTGTVFSGILRFSLISEVYRQTGE